MSGEPLFMGILTLVLMALLVVALSPHLGLLNRFSFAKDEKRRQKALRSLGLFALIFGLFTQLLGLYGALELIRVWGEVEASMLYDGLRVSSIPTGYGLVIFIVARYLSKLTGRQAASVV